MRSKLPKSSKYAHYPVVKIPILLASLKSVHQPQRVDRSNLTIIKSTDLTTNTDTFVNIDARTNSSPNYRGMGYAFGYGLLFLSTLIFAVAIARDLPIFLQSGISFCFGIATINITSLFPPKHYMPMIVKGKTPHRAENTQIIETIPIDVPALLVGKVMPYGKKAVAQVGVSEAQFERYLKTYFSTILHPGYEFIINDDYKYSSDFTFILANGISLIVEVDEPYEGKSKKPHHCIDDGKDDNRDEFFLKGNWAVIRFSEFQVCAHPIECCYTIAKVIHSIDSTSSLTHKFTGVDRLPTDRRWTQKESRQMAKRDYRLQYLKTYGIYNSKVSLNR
jgi:hypothetical protein